MKKGTENEALREEIIFLEKSSKKNKAPIWANVARMLSASRRSRIEINIGKLAKLTGEGGVVVVPGKVLGTGSIGHKLTIASWCAAKGVRERVSKAGGRMITIRELVESNPSGKGVVILK